MKFKMKYLFFYFYFLLKFFVNCLDCVRCKVLNGICTHDNDFIQTCDSRCRPNFEITKPTCVLWQNIEPGEKYYIDNGQCFIGSDITCNYIIFNSKQCVKSRPSHLKIMEGFLYPNCDKDNRQPAGTTKCKCKNFYKQTTDMGKKLNYCYIEDETSCEPSHRSYNYDSKLCSTDNSFKK